MMRACVAGAVALAIAGPVAAQVGVYPCTLTRIAEGGGRDMTGEGRTPGTVVVTEDAAFFFPAFPGDTVHEMGRGRSGSAHVNYTGFVGPVSIMVDSLPGPYAMRMEGANQRAIHADGFCRQNP